MSRDVAEPQIAKMVALKRLADNALTQAAKQRARQRLDNAFTQFVWGDF